MSRWREQVINTGFAVFEATGVHRWLAPYTRGRGAILMFHHVRPLSAQAFAPNRLLEVTPQFLDMVLHQVRRRGFDIVSMDEAVSRLQRPRQVGEPPFVVLTFDDGYIDNRDYALPVMKRHQTPFTLFVTSGFADRTARLWWRELEQVIARLDQVTVDLPQGAKSFDCAMPLQKAKAFEGIYWALRALPEPHSWALIADLCHVAGVEPAKLVEGLCLDWDGIRALAREPLCSIGVHTLTHPRLALYPLEHVRSEMIEARQRIESEIQMPVRHFSYPVGDPTSAGPREFALAEALGFASAVTTRPGMLMTAHGQRLHALPRLSVNGCYATMSHFDILLSGAPFALMNRGKAT